MHGLAVQGDCAAHDVDNQATGLEARRLACHLHAMAQCNTQTGHELFGTEGLGHVIDRARVERGDLAGLCIARREHQHRHRMRQPQGFQQIETVAIRKAEVEHHHVRRLAAREREPCMRGAGLEHLVAVGDERGAQESADRGFVLDDEGQAWRSAHFRASLPRRLRRWRR